MAKKKLSDELRQAIAKCGKSRYRIAKDLGLSETTLSLFMTGKRGLGLENIDAIADLLDLHICTGKRK